MRKKAATLRSYFGTERQQRRALKALGDYFDPSELDLYDASQRAFDPSSNRGEALRNFQKIDDALGSLSWGAKRSNIKGARSACWPARQTFKTIKKQFRDFAPGGRINLLNFPTSGTMLRLESCLAKMKGIKQKKDYPLMIVSKFLHFYNPGLFPIYDGAVVWGRICNGYFKEEFREFCERENIPKSIVGTNADDTAAFLRYYMMWASSFLSVAHAGFMQVFEAWLAKQPGAGLPNRMFDATTLYARAFEYTAIGAAKVGQMAHLRQFIRECRQALPTLNLSEADRREAEVQLQTAETQAHSTKPKSTVIEGALDALKKILPRAGDPAATQELLKRLKHLTPWL